MTDNGKEDKIAKGTKKCVIKRMIKFDDYKNCLLQDKVLLKSQQRFISKKHDVYTEDINIYRRYYYIHMDIKAKNILIILKIYKGISDNN